MSESDVETALELLLAERETPLGDRVKELVRPREPEVPEMAPYEADLGEYDALLSTTAEVSS